MVKSNRGLRWAIKTLRGDSSVQAQARAWEIIEEIEERLAPGVGGWICRDDSEIASQLRGLAEVYPASVFPEPGPEEAEAAMKGGCALLRHHSSFFRQAADYILLLEGELDAIPWEEVPPELAPPTREGR